MLVQLIRTDEVAPARRFGETAPPSLQLHSQAALFTVRRVAGACCDAALLPRPARLLWMEVAA